MTGQGKFNRSVEGLATHNVVEQAHYTSEQMLPAKVAEQKTCKPPWSRWTWLPHIVCKCKFLFVTVFFTHYTK